MNPTDSPVHPVVAGDFAPDDAPSSACQPPVNAVDRAIESRQSMREFLPAPVPRALILHLLELASRAPSGTNTQPWKVHVLTGAAKDALVRDIQAAHDDPAAAAQHQQGPGEQREQERAQRCGDHLEHAAVGASGLHRPRARRVPARRSAAVSDA